MSLAVLLVGWLIALVKRFNLDTKINGTNNGIFIFRFLAEMAMSVIKGVTKPVDVLQIKV
jgi:hypothetical protein